MTPKMVFVFILGFSLGFLVKSAHSLIQNYRLLQKIKEIGDHIANYKEGANKQC